MSKLSCIKKRRKKKKSGNMKAILSFLNIPKWLLKIYIYMALFSPLEIFHLWKIRIYFCLLLYIYLFYLLYIYIFFFFSFGGGYILLLQLLCVFKTFNISSVFQIAVEISIVFPKQLILKNCPDVFQMETMIPYNVHRTSVFVWIFVLLMTNSWMLKT